MRGIVRGKTEKTGVESMVTEIEAVTKNIKTRGESGWPRKEKKKGKKVQFSFVIFVAISMQCSSTYRT